jgi:hypothetical protein
MGVLANGYANSAIDQMFRSATWAKPTHNWLALFTVLPTDAGGGTEATGGGYARVDLPPLDTNWLATQGGTSGSSSGTTGTTSNAVVVTYAGPVSAPWGTIVGIGSFSLVTAGVLQIWAPLNNPIVISSGDTPPSFAVGSIVFTFPRS